MRINGFSLLLAGLLLLIPPMTFNASASCVGLDLEDAGNGSYRVVARGLVNIGAIDLMLTYDKAALSKPSVKRGEFVSNWLIFMPHIVETAGTVRIAMVNEPPVSGSGTVAIVTFTPTGKSWGRPVLTCELTGLDASNQQTGSSSSSGTGQGANTATGAGSGDTNTDSSDSGSTQTNTDQQSDSGISTPSETVTTVETPATVEIPETVETPMPEEAPATVEPIQQNSSSTGSAVSSAPYIAAGTINLGTDAQQPPLELEPPLEQESEVDDDSAQLEESPDAIEQEMQGHPVDAPASDRSRPIPPVAGPAQNQKYVVYPGVLERFREYGGEKSSKAFIALFKQPVMPSIKQNPSVFIADGTTVLEVLVELPERGSQAPNFALRGASLQSLRKQGDNTWMIKAVPESGRVDAVLTVVNGENIVDYPFTIAPRVDVNLDKKGAVDEADFALFLATAGAGKAPSFDLNGDGRRDYLDDYIFTANYLAVTGGEGAKN